ncbi:T9SS type A sorting domain-containing protein [Mesonia mobilis]|uniref:T9SS type A sorting domain-containing protein n=1 Tax=Mesonia mobilis TaxID=369791 RepID=UPI0026EA0B98|nr:T9SS type A sorting domain-containing protein [Mesonia mobilis]
MKKNYFLFVLASVLLLTFQNANAQCAAAQTGDYPVEGTFGDFEWVAYAYNYPSGTYSAPNYDFSDYRGYYVEAGYGQNGSSFDSSLSWIVGESPSSAANYIGCSVNYNYHNISYRRRGFDSGTYQINLDAMTSGQQQGYNDFVRLIIDGVQVWFSSSCCQYAGNVWTGTLDENSEVELQLNERTNNSFARLQLVKQVTENSFGDDEWHVACYNGDNFQSYAGNYTHSVLSFDSSDLWSQDTNPSNAFAYNGIAISNDNHSYVYRREGFDCGYYNIDIVRHDDDVEFIIDGVTVYQYNDWDNGNGQPDIWEGYLDENSQVEIKLKEDSGSSILAVDFNYIFGPSNTGEYVWTGEISSNPTQTGNWCGGVPINDGTSSILIREDAPNFPYYGAVANLNNMILEQNAEATLVAGTVLNIYGNLENNGVINTTDIELNFVGSSAQTFSGHGIEVDNFTLDNTNGLTLDLDTDEVLTVQNVLTVTNGTLTTNDQVLLACNFVDPDRRTAQIADLTNGDISGLVTVEQCFPGRRAFRLVSPSVTTSTTIRENWQENQNNTGTNFPTDNQNSNDGYGTHITGSQSGANGFDATPSGNPSMFMFDNVNQNWSAVTNTNATTLTAGAPYRLMIRGSRAINVTSNSVGVSNTILSTEGAVLKGDIDQNTFNSTAGSYNFFGNPYHAAINVASLFGDASTSNVNANFYYIWDPTLGGTPTPGQPGGRGAFVAIDLSDGSNGSGSDANQFLQPMQAGFFVTANAGTTPNLHFSESIKAVTADQTSVMRNANLNAKSIGIKLYNEVSYLNGDTPSDGLKIKFASDGNNAFDMKDAPKYGNLDENLARNISNTHYLALESRNLPVAGEILPFFINQYRTENYVFEIDVENITEVEVFLKDNYLNELTPLSTGVNQVSFIIDQDVEASVAFDRFELRFAESNLGAEDFNQNQLMVYPNPIKGNELQIRLGEMSSEVDVVLYDMLGKQVYRSVQQPTQEVVSLTDLDLANGIYILKVQTAEGKLFTQKIVKE